MSDSRDSAVGSVGAQVGPVGVSYRTWAPDLGTLEVVVEQPGVSRRLPLRLDGQGYWSGTDEGGRAGDLYRFLLPDGSLLPDVASRFQPQGVHGASECIDPAAYRWRCTSWKRPGWNGQTTYELHVGTFTLEGTFRGAIPQLAALAELGVQAIELMPVADFAGARNWGYDGVSLFAPARCYGRPDDLRALVDAAHELGLAVILDVVYNHVGPQGNYFPRYCGDYFRHDKGTPWGNSFNLDGPRSAPVRAMMIANAAYWLDEFRFDGLRLDATHAIPDSSSRHILREIADAAHQRGAFVVAEDERNSADLVRAAATGAGMDAAWADDFHHQVRVALTGSRLSYFSAYRGTPEDIADTVEHGWTYRGQPFPGWQGRPRGSECESLPTDAFVYCIENHDQVGNRPRGERLEQLVSPAQFRAASMLLCLSPYPVLLFMGQEWAATTPFLFFTDHGGELGAAVSAGRKREFSGFADDRQSGAIPDPEDPATFEASKLRWSERQDLAHAAVVELYQECLRERRELAREGAFERGLWRIDVYGTLIALRYVVSDTERMLLVALDGSRISAKTLPDALATGNDAEWRLLIGSESHRFGGKGHSYKEGGWSIEGPAAVWLEVSMKGALRGA
jgi:maltooligosyltrehalose trehalohydrolase